MAIMEKVNGKAAAVGMGIVIALMPLQRSHADTVQDKPAMQNPSPTITGNKGAVCGTNIYADKGSTVTVNCFPEKSAKAHPAKHKAQVHKSALPNVDCRTYVQNATDSTYKDKKGVERYRVIFNGHAIDTGVTVTSAAFLEANREAWLKDRNIRRTGGTEGCLPGRHEAHAEHLPPPLVQASAPPMTGIPFDQLPLQALLPPGGLSHGPMAYMPYGNPIIFILPTGGLIGVVWVSRLPFAFDTGFYGPQNYYNAINRVNAFIMANGADMRHFQPGMVIPIQRQ